MPAGAIFARRVKHDIRCTSSERNRIGVSGSSMRIHSTVRSIGSVCLGAGAALTLACAPIVSVGSSSPGTIVTNTNGGAAADLEYRRIEREIVDELNAVRANPAAYSANITAGSSAAHEAIDALRSQVKLPALAYSAELSNATRDLALDQSQRGTVGHVASDGSSPTQRIARYGTWQTSYNESVDYGPIRSGRDVVVTLLIDNGVPDRGHRHNILDPTARVVGVTCAPHPKYGSLCVIDEAGGFTAR